MIEDAIVRWTARLFVACYVTRIVIDAGGYQDSRSQRLARWFWTVGCLICWIHFAVAFQLVMNWSHRAAYEHVLIRTEQYTGIATGVGVYVNYAFGLLWLGDTVIWWRGLDWPDRRIPYWIVQSSFAFLMIQSTAVFGPPFWIPVVIVIFMLLVALRWKRSKFVGTT